MLWQSKHTHRTNIIIQNACISSCINENLIEIYWKILIGMVRSLHDMVRSWFRRLVVFVRSRYKQKYCHNTIYIIFILQNMYQSRTSRWCHRWPLMFITYYLSDRAESVDFRNVWSKKSKSLSTVQQNKSKCYYIQCNDNIIYAGAISNIGLLFHVVFYQIFNYFERCLWSRPSVKVKDTCISWALGAPPTMIRSFPRWNNFKEGMLYVIL